MVDFLPDYFCLCKRDTWSVRGLTIGWVTCANHKVAYLLSTYYFILYRSTYLPGHRTNKTTSLLCGPAESSTVIAPRRTASWAASSPHTTTSDYIPHNLHNKHF